MPLYEYACTSCDRQIEVMQRFADDPLTICEECGGALKKLLSAPAFQFKGSGWYATDYAKKDRGDSESSKSDAKASNDKKAEGDKADAKSKETDSKKTASDKKEKTGPTTSEKTDS